MRREIFNVIKDKHGELLKEEKCLIDLKADQDEIKEVLGNEYQDYNLERYQQTDIHRIANVDSKVIIST